MGDCLFCRISRKELAAKVVLEEKEVLAFEDINPQAPVHLLIIPRKHIPTLLDLSPQDQAVFFQLFTVANRLARERGIAEKGFRTVFNCNALAGQSVYHLHLHLLGGRPMTWPPG